MKASNRQKAVLVLIVMLPIGCSESIGLAPSDPDAAGTVADAGIDVAMDVSVPIDAVRNDTSEAGHLAETSVDGVPPDARDATVEEGGTCESRCASGACEMNGDCKRCVNDQECTGGRVCGSGVCAPRCGAGGIACASSFVCCDEHCVDTTLDSKHCGACGTACSTTQFCATAPAPSACKSNVLANVCNAKKATFLLDGLQDDQDATVVVQAAIAARCTPPPMAMGVSQSVSTAINTTTGQPVAGGGELLVAVGGDSAQRLVKYLESSGTSRVYNEYDGLNTLWFKRRDAGNPVIATITRSTLTPTHDYFLVEVVLDPISGTLSFVLYGLDSPGTKAGAFYFANTMLPSIATQTQSWYLYEWMGLNAGGAGAGDTFTLLASGM